MAITIIIDTYIILKVTKLTLIPNHKIPDYTQSLSFHILDMD